jgi:hypothetical protein
MSYVVLNERGIKRLFTRQGAVGRIIDQKAKLIEDNARTIIQSKFVSRTGDLEAGLKKVPLDSPEGYHVAVGSDAQHRGFPYARALELGINPITGGPLLGGNTRGPDGPQVLVEDKAFMVPAVLKSGFRRRA